MGTGTAIPTDIHSARITTISRVMPEAADRARQTRALYFFPAGILALKFIPDFGNTKSVLSIH